MTTHQCDDCGAAIATAEAFKIGFGWSQATELCDDCAQAFLPLMQERGYDTRTLRQTVLDKLRHDLDSEPVQPAMPAPKM